MPESRRSRPTRTRTFLRLHLPPRSRTGPRPPDAARSRLNLPWLALAVLAFTAAATIVRAQPSKLSVTREGEEMRISAPGLRFIAGGPLERLRDGISVTYVFSVQLVPEGRSKGGTLERGANAAFRIEKRFVVSYDLWEERFEVVASGQLSASASHLTEEMAEAWCLDKLRVPAASAPAGSAFVLRLEGFVEYGDAPGAEAAGGLTLTALLDRLSRKAHEAPGRWEAVSPSMRLRDVAGRTGR